VERLRRPRVHSARICGCPDYGLFKFKALNFPVI
jgi:hypothetical protein